MSDEKIFNSMTERAAAKEYERTRLQNNSHVLCRVIEQLSVVSPADQARIIKALNNLIKEKKL